jgi:hypothetical protein
MSLEVKVRIGTLACLWFIATMAAETANAQFSNLSVDRWVRYGDSQTLVHTADYGGAGDTVIVYAQIYYYNSTNQSVDVWLNVALADDDDVYAISLADGGESATIGPNSGGWVYASTSFEITQAQMNNPTGIKIKCTWDKSFGGAAGSDLDTYWFFCQ